MSDGDRLQPQPKLAKPLWTPDSAAAACAYCTRSFTFTLRRHHCRFCGLIFCRSCANHTASLAELGYTRPQRICRACYVLSVNCSKRVARTAAAATAESDDIKITVPTHVLSQSELLNEYTFACVYKCLPKRLHHHHGDNWSLVYSTSAHGYSTSTFISRSRAAGDIPTVLLVRDDKDCVIGCFVTKSWRPQGMARTYFGTGESFVFSFFGTNNSHTNSSSNSSSIDNNSNKKNFSMYPWSQRNSAFQHVSEKTSRHFFIAVGDLDAAIYLSRDFESGTSGACSTFDSPPLTFSPFKITTVELWSV